MPPPPSLPDNVRQPAGPGYIYIANTTEPDKQYWTAAFNKTGVDGKFATAYVWEAGHITSKKLQGYNSVNIHFTASGIASLIENYFELMKQRGEKAAVQQEKIIPTTPLKSPPVQEVRKAPEKPPVIQSKLLDLPYREFITRCNQIYDPSEELDLIDPAIWIALHVKGYATPESVVKAYLREIK